jgi:hypothetical protein
MRMRLVVGIALAWLVTAAPALGADRVVERGVVQSTGASSLVLRALDGVELVVPVGPRTRVRLNGLPASLTDIRPGYVAVAVRAGGGPALRVRAFGRLARTVEQGRVVRVGSRILVVRAGSGRVRIALTGRTVVRRNGHVVEAGVLRSGMRVVVQQAADGSALVVRVTKVTST